MVSVYRYFSITHCHRMSEGFSRLSIGMPPRNAIALHAAANSFVLARARVRPEKTEN